MVQKLLSDAFAGPATTKPYNEDVFRDMRRTFEGVPTSKVTPWNRQDAAIGSLMNRAPDLVLKHVEVKQETLNAFLRLKNKKLLTNSIFTPPTNAQKAKKAFFDCIVS